jgi:hypothetical protein
MLEHQEAERLAQQIDWTKVKTEKPPQSWYDEEVNPFEAEEKP